MATGKTRQTRQMKKVMGAAVVDVAPPAKPPRPTIASLQADIAAMQARHVAAVDRMTADFARERKDLLSQIDWKQWRINGLQREIRALKVVNEALIERAIGGQAGDGEAMALSKELD